MTFNPDMLLVATVSVTFALAVLAALISWSHRWSAPSRRTLALFFATFALSEFDTVAAALTRDLAPALRDSTELIAFVANFCLMPLFLVFVRDLAAVPRSSTRPRTLAGHLALPVAALIFAVAAMLLPEATRAVWLSGAPAAAPPPGLRFLRDGFTLLTAALVVQWAVYAVWIVRTKTVHIQILKQHFASTEGMELRWVAGLAVAMGTYILQSMAGETVTLLGGQDPVGPLLDAALVLIVVAALAVWGLRPTPELDTAARALAAAQPPGGRKYEKSALGPDQADRIARKLLHAMEEDRLYRDPNLTLAALSSHVGVSLNYVSQVLNQTLGQSFFEFVNGWRVREAIPLVEAGESTILAIAYEAGFNSRSAFYAAFKRVTGVTPTAYKIAPPPQRAHGAAGPGAATRAQPQR